MGTFYRNRETGLIQAHPVSGIGDSLNSDEVGEDAKPIVPLGASKQQQAAASKLAKGASTSGNSAGDSNKQEDQ